MGESSRLFETMRISGFVLSLLFTNSVTTQPNYEDCVALISTISNYLTTPEIMDYQVQFLVSQLCPMTENPDECVEDLSQFWPRVAKVMWPGYYSPNEEWMCGDNSAPQVFSITCGECLEQIQTTLDQLVSEEFISGIVSALSGDAFCGMEDDIDKCSSAIEALIPVALPALVGIYNVYDIGVPVCNSAMPGTC